jgi:hypothetical protein
MIGTAVCIRKVYIVNCRLTGARGVEWWDKTPNQTAMNGGVVVADSVIEADYLAAISAKNGSISFVRNELKKPVQVAADGFNPMIL